MVNTPKGQGVIGEAKVLSKFIELGIPVSIPFGDNCSYDLVAEFNGKLNKIQVKSATKSKDGITVFTLRKSRINRTEQIRSHYSVGDLDYYALYAMALDEIYLVPFTDSPRDEISIRYSPSKNSQRKRSRLREDYLIDNILMNSK